MVIVGGQAPIFDVGAFVFTRKTLESLPDGPGPYPTKKIEDKLNDTRRIGLALSGGGSRAMAFHLGCFRALHDRGLLGQVQVISTVSGGAVLGAMYAYTSDAFDEFDRRVCARLRKGFVGAAFLNWKTFPTLVGDLFTALTSGCLAALTDGFRLLFNLILFAVSLTGIPTKQAVRAVSRLQPPWRRWTSRTSLFRNAFLAELGDIRLNAQTRGGIGVIFNSTDLRTGSAFRFGNRESGLWRYDRVILKDNAVRVAAAVVPSAAYPILLPSADRAPVFLRKDSSEVRERVILTDGGVFENLGVGPLEPGRKTNISTNTNSPPYIIACNAGAGIMAETVFPFWWPSRMARSFEVTFRKLQDSTMKRLHDYRANGQLEGFILPYLGQLEASMPFDCPDFVRREQVHDYPTNFSAMSENDLNLLTQRGEELTRFLISYYCPEL